MNFQMTIHIIQGVPNGYEACQTPHSSGRTR